MATNSELLEITNSMIKKLHDDINILQERALQLSVAGDYDACGAALQKQREAIGAQIAMVEAAKHLATQ